jgi:hypothetical protein
LTPGQEDRLRARLQAIASLRQIYEVIRDLVEFEKEPTPLAFLVIRSILQDLAWRIEGLPPESSFIEHVVRIQQQLNPAIARVVNVYRGTDPAALLSELNILCSQWAMLREELH